MIKCKNCGILIEDETAVCPLCHMALGRGESKGHNLYPNIARKTQMMHFLMKVLVFLGCVAEGICVLVNYYHYDGRHRWAIVSGLYILYALLCFNVAIVRKHSFHYRLSQLAIFSGFMLVGADYFGDFHGWSLNYGLPVMSLVLCAATMLFMVIKSRSYTSYLMLQVLNLIFSFVLLLFLLLDKTTSIALTWTAFCSALILFSGTIVFGGIRARNELQRRFNL